MPPKLIRLSHHLLVAMLFVSADAFALRPYLYEVRRGEAVSYLFGTLHFGVGLDDVRPFVEARMRASRKIYFEVVNDREAERRWTEDPVAALVRSSEVASRGGRALSPRDRARLVEHYGFDRRIADALMDDSCDMFVIALMLRLPSLDSELQLAAMDSGIPVAPLEDQTVRARADELDPPERCQVREMLRYSRGQWSALESRMIRSYREGRERQLRSRELQVRNAHWLRTLVPEMSAGGVFVAVGVDHLFERREGLLQKLRDAGFGVRRVSSP